MCLSKFMELLFLMPFNRIELRMKIDFILYSFTVYETAHQKFGRFIQKKQWVHVHIFTYVYVTENFQFETVKVELNNIFYTLTNKIVQYMYMYK